MYDNQRSAYWDNLKAILIFLVVLGHYILPVNRSGRSLTSAYYWIYLFHMPAFVLTSGYFSKRYIRKGAPNVGKLLGFLLLYFIFILLLWGGQFCF